MPSLTQTLGQQRGQVRLTATGLREEAAPLSLDQAARTQGTVSPDTPMGAAAIGATATQAAAAAAAPHRRGVMEDQSTQDLQTTQRRETVREQELTEEQRKVTRGPVFQQLGAVGDRIANIMDQRLAEMDLGTSDMQLRDDLDIDAQSMELLQNKDFTAFNRRRRELNQEPITSDNLSEFFDTEGRPTPQAPAPLVIDDVLAEMDLDRAELSESLGISPEDLEVMSVGEFAEAVEGVLRQTFAEEDQLFSLVDDFNVPPVIRAAARRSIRALNADARAARQQTDNLMQLLDDAQVVEVGGEMKRIEELLDDDGFAQVVDRWMDDDMYRDEMARTNPELHELIQNHQDVFATSLERLSNRLSELDAVSAANAALQEPIPGAGRFSDELMELLFPGFDPQFSDSPLDTSKYPLLDELINDPGRINDPAGAIEALNNIAQIDPDVAHNIMKRMTPDQMAEANWPLVARNVEVGHAVRTAETPEQVFEALGVDPRDLNRRIVNYNATVGLGLADKDSDIAKLSKAVSGNLGQGFSTDRGAEIFKNAAKLNVTSLMSGDYLFSTGIQKVSGNQQVEQRPEKRTPTGDLWTKAMDGKIDNRELSEILQRYTPGSVQGIQVEEWERLLDSANLTKDARKTLTQWVAEQRKPEIVPAPTAYTAPPAPKKSFVQRLHEDLRSQIDPSRLFK